MTATKKTPTAADLSAILPALDAIARTTPFAFATITQSEDGVAPANVWAQVELPAPFTGSNPITVRAYVAYGSQWKVETSGASWKIPGVDDLRTMTAVLAVAQSIHALLKSIG